MAAAGLAFGALAVTGKGYVLLSCFGFLVLASYFSSARLPSDSWTPWMLRLLLLAMVAAANVIEPCRTRGHGLYDARYVHAFGQLSAAELLLQCWLARPFGGPGGVFALVLSGFVLLTASNTFDGRYLPYFAPLFMGCALLAWRLARPRLRTPERPLRRLPAAWIGLALVLLALVLGEAMAFTLGASKNRLYRLVRNLEDGLRGGRATGFSERPVLGRDGSLKRSLARILRVEGLPSGQYLRGMTFDTYRDGTWGPLLEQRQLLPTAVTTLHPQAGGPGGRITRLVDGFPYLFAPLHCAGLAPERVLQVERDENQGAVLRVNVPAPYSYGVFLASAPEQAGPLASPPTELEKQRCLVLPEPLREPLRDRAQAIAGARSAALASVQAIERHLRQTHAYSLTAQPGPGDPVLDFLAHRRAAHCEYFASAAVLLLRALEIPSRYVVGFSAHEPAGAQALMVRQQDAHAWCESWIEGRGWITVEATPPEGRPEESSARASGLRRAWEWTHDTALLIGDWLAALSWLQLAAFLTALAVPVIILLWLRERLARRRTRKEAPRNYAAPGPVLAALAVRFENLLRRGGRACPLQRTWGEFAASLEREPQAAKPSFDLRRVQAFVASYNQVRFGRPDDPAGLARLEALLSGLERTSA